MAPARVGPRAELPKRPAMNLDGCIGVGAGRKVRDKRGHVIGNAGYSDGWRWRDTALAASAHGVEVGESGSAWHVRGIDAIKDHGEVRLRDRRMRNGDKQMALSHVSLINA